MFMMINIFFFSCTNTAKNSCIMISQEYLLHDITSSFVTFSFQGHNLEITILVDKLFNVQLEPDFAPLSFKFFPCHL